MFINSALYATMKFEYVQNVAVQRAMCLEKLQSELLCTLKTKLKQGKLKIQLDVLMLKQSEIVQESTFHPAAQFRIY